MKDETVWELPISTKMQQPFNEIGNTVKNCLASQKCLRWMRDRKLTRLKQEITNICGL